MKGRSVIPGLFALVAALVAPLFSPALAGDDDKKITVGGELRARWEILENTNDFTDTSSDGLFDDALNFAPYKASVNVNAELNKDVNVFFEVQGFGNFGDRDEHLLLGFGDPAQQSDVDDVDGELRGVDLYQAWVGLKNIGGSKFSAQIGRMEATLGNELHLGDLDHYNGQFFDGARAMFDFDGWDLGFLFFNIEERSAPGIDGGCISTFLPSSNCADDNITLFGAHANFEFENGMALEPYALQYRDGEGGISVSDNLTETPFIMIPSSVRTLTVGALLSGGNDDEGLVDWSVEAALQNGEVDPNGADLDHSASVFEGTVGFTLGDERQHRFHLSAFMSSGDDNTSDSDAEGFFPLFPDHHANNRLGNLDLFGPSLLGGLGIAGLGTGLTDYSVGYTGTFGAHRFMAAYHMMSATETGWIQDEADGVDEDDLGDEIDLSYMYDYTKNVSFGVEVSSFSPGDAFMALASEGFEGTSTGDLEDNALRVASQVHVRW